MNSQPQILRKGLIDILDIKVIAKKSRVVI